jgi:hypothetical protein
MEGYVAGGPFVGRLKFACVTVKLVPLMLTHCVWLLFHSFVCTWYSPPATDSVANCPQSVTA